MNEAKRSLTAEELAILRLIRRVYGEQNTTEDVFFSDADEAVIFVRDTAGVAGICVVLTNVAEESRSLGLTEEQTCERFLIPT